MKLPPSRILSLARVVRGFMTGQLLTTVLLFRAISFRDLAQTPQKKALAGSPDDDDVSNCVSFMLVLCAWQLCRLGIDSSPVCSGICSYLYYRYGQMQEQIGDIYPHLPPSRHAVASFA